MTIHKEKSPLTVGAVNEELKSIAERSNLTVPSQPPYKRHKTYKQENGISYSLCGHTRPTAEAQQIIANLGEAWNHCPPCEPCLAMSEVTAEHRREQAQMKKALRLAQFLLEHLENNR